MRPTVLAVARLLTQNWLVPKIHHPHKLGVVNPSTPGSPHMYCMKVDCTLSPTQCDIMHSKVLSL